jgi:hypothetical protein
MGDLWPLLNLFYPAFVKTKTVSKVRHIRTAKCKVGSQLSGELLKYTKYEERSPSAEPFSGALIFI